MNRFVSFYLLAWVPYLGLYTLLYLISGEFSPLGSVLSAVINVTPVAVAGLVVLRAAGALVERASGWRLLATHALQAATFALLTAGSSATTFILVAWLRDGSNEYARMIFAWQLFMNLLVYCCLALFAHAWGMGERLQQERARTARAEQLRVRAELEALRAQLNPHFLFNTLHSLLSLVRRDPQGAEDALERFGDLLRYTLRTQRGEADDVTLGAEWGFVSNYLELERLRLGDRLRLHASIDATALSARVPAFCLQPLVENAIRHSVAPRSGGGTLWIDATRDGDALHIEVADDGPGAEPEALESSDGMGLRLVRQRLEMLGEDAELRIDTQPGTGFRVSVRVPAPERAAWAATEEPTNAELASPAILRPRRGEA